MSILSQFYLHIDLHLSEEDRSKAKEYFQVLASRYASVIYRQDVDVQVDIVNGSIKVWLRVVGALYIAIGQYGSFRAGVNQLIEDSRYFYRHIKIEVQKDGLPDEAVLACKRLVATPDKLRKILLRIDRFEKVQSQLSAAEQKRELTSIVYSIERVLSEIRDREDYNFVLSGIAEPYRPPRSELPYSFNEGLLYRRREEEWQHLRFENTPCPLGLPHLKQMSAEVEN